SPTTSPDPSWRPEDSDPDYTLDPEEPVYWTFAPLPFSCPRELDSAARFQFFGNDFSQAEMIDCDFRYGIDLSRQKLPQGPGVLLCRERRAGDQASAGACAG
ncbi:hypothetical protein V7F85_12275, partial [Cutibacterium avidum]|uniref:hypothetical protein n=1 Tax=Cutibacterium avidum TaxID=33010 RepID=UPI002FF331DE